MKTIAIWLAKKFINWEELINKLDEELAKKAKESDNTWDDYASEKLHENKELIIKILKSL